MALWEFRGLTAYMDLRTKAFIPLHIKPQARKKRIASSQSIRASRNRFQFVVQSFHKSTISAGVEVVGNLFKVIAKCFDKFVLAPESSPCNFSNPLL